MSSSEASPSTCLVHSELLPISTCLCPTVTGQVAEILGQTDNFRAERQQSGRSRVWYNAQNRRHYNVDIMEPGDIHQTYPDHESGIMTVNSTRILSPALLLDYKCFSWASREAPQKRLNDAQRHSFPPPVHGESRHQNLRSRGSQYFLGLPRGVSRQLSGVSEAL